MLRPECLGTIWRVGPSMNSGSNKRETRCDCGAVAVKWDGGGWSCAQCLELNRQALAALEREILRLRAQERNPDELHEYYRRKNAEYRTIRHATPRRTNL